MSSVRKRTVALGIAAAIALSVASPSFGKTYPGGGAARGGYNSYPGDNRCYTDEGYGRWSTCDH